MELANITLLYNKGTDLEHYVLSGVNMFLNEGDVVGVVGQNGAGKSTLCKIISGEALPDIGTIIIGDVNCTHLSLSQRSPFIAKVFQNPTNGVALDLTVFENLAFAYKRGKSRSLFRMAINKTYRELFIKKLSVLKMNMEDKLDHCAGSLSGGQRQALSVIMATLCPAKILILDEPTASLHHKTADIVMSLIFDIIAERRLTTILITHNMSEAKRCDKSMILQDGVLTDL